MENLATGWIAEIAKSGLGWMLFAASLYVIWKLYTDNKACQEQYRNDTVKMAVALEQAARAMSETSDVERSRNENDKVNASILQALIKQVDISDDRAKERAEGIVNTLRGLTNAR
jgi:hypothetical protein